MWSYPVLSYKHHSYFEQRNRGIMTPAVAVEFVTGAHVFE